MKNNESQMNKKFGVIGAGKLGEIILQTLSERDCLGSYGTKTNHQNFYKFNINTDSIADLPNADVFVICIPPSKYELEAVKKFIESAKKIPIILISSTSVYGTNSGAVDETSITTPLTENAIKLVALEDLVLKTKNGIVVRPAGLYSEGFHPGKFLSGKTQIKNPDAPVNLISRNEVADAVISLAQQNEIRTLNLANKDHPSKRDYYTSYCERNSLALPHFEQSNTPAQKIINSIHDGYSFTTALP